ncbi:MAG: hypothetical protein ACAI25_05465 [Planctomycetota bacterium]
MSADGRPERFAAAAIVGLAKGVLSGLLIAGVPAFVLRTQTPPVPFEEVGRIVAGLVLAGAAICGLDATSSRIAKEAGQRALRFLAGLLGPLAFVSPQYALTAGPVVPLIPASALPYFAGMGLVLGLGFVLAGEPDTPPHKAQGCARLAIAVSVAVVGVALYVTFNGRFSDGLGVCWGGLFIGYIGAAIFWFVQQLVAFALPPLAIWLEPDRDIDAPDHPSAAVVRELEAFERSLREANETQTMRREMNLHDALAALDRLEPLTLGDDRSITPATVAQRRAEVLLLLGRLDDAAKLAPVAREATAVLCEVARRRGDLDAAATLAQDWLDAARAERSFRAKASQVSALALLALVRADQGRFEDASAAHAALEKIPAWHARAFRHLNGPEVAAYIAACRNRTRPGETPTETPTS